MLVDVKTRAEGVTFNGGKRLQKGVYETPLMFASVVFETKDRHRLEDGYDESIFEHHNNFGVCDSPEQVIELLRLREIETPVFMIVTRVLDLDNFETLGRHIDSRGRRKKNMGELFAYWVHQPKDSAILREEELKSSAADTKPSARAADPLKALTDEDLIGELIKQDRRGTSRARRARDFAGYIMMMMDDFLPRHPRLKQEAYDHVQLVGFRHDIEIASVPPERDQQAAAEMDRLMRLAPQVILMSCRYCGQGIINGHARPCPARERDEQCCEP
jgi:hypothetical protein